MSRNLNLPYRNEREGRVAQMSRQEEIIARKRQEILEKQKTSELAKQVVAAQSSSTIIPETSKPTPDLKHPLNLPKQTFEVDPPPPKNSFTNDGSFFENFKKITDAAKKAEDDRQKLEAERQAMAAEIKAKLADEQRLKEEEAAAAAEAAKIMPMNETPFFNIALQPNPMFHPNIPLFLTGPPPPPPMPIDSPIEPEAKAQQADAVAQTFEVLSGNTFTNDNLDQQQQQINKPHPLSNNDFMSNQSSSTTTSLQVIPTTIDGLIEYIANNGDDFEGNIISQIEQMNERTLFRFLNDKNSENYKIYREKVIAFRQKAAVITGHMDNEKTETLANNDKYDPEDILHDEPEEQEPRKDFSDDSDSEYMQEAKERNLVNMQKRIDSGTAKKRFASESYTEYSSDEGDRTDEEDYKDMYRRIQMRENALNDESNDCQDKNSNADNSGADSNVKERRTKRSRWGEKIETQAHVQLQIANNPGSSNPIPANLTSITRSDPALLNYARQNYGTVNLSEEDWKKCEEHFKVNLLYQNMLRKREEIDRLAKTGRFKYEYDSDEDTTNGTWEHKMRMAEMEATAAWSTALNRQTEGKHHIGDYLPPEELKKFMEIYKSKQTNKEPDLSDYKEYKLKEDNKGFQMLQKLGWTEGQGLGADGGGIVNPVNKSVQRDSNQGLGLTSNATPEAGDNEYEAYRKRMMLAYRFRPNPLNNPRRAYY